MISITINGKSLEVSENLTVLQAAEQGGIVIPTLCYHKDLTPFGGCRLCVVEIQGARLPATSCTMPVSRGMIVLTETEKLVRYRRFILESLLSKYYDAGYTRLNDKTGLAADTQFAYWVNYYGIDIEKAMSKKPLNKIDSDPNPFVWVDMNKCIQCTRCIRACAEVQGRFVWGLANRGYTCRIVAGADTTMLQARCESCGACVAYCPTGALDNKMSVSLGKPDRLVTTTCSYCGVGCQMDLNVKDDVEGGRVIRVTSNPNAPVNGMHLCVKGRYGYEFISHPNRLKKPRVRQYLLEKSPLPKNLSRWVEVDWETALDVTARLLEETRERYGPSKIGLLSSGRYLNEENYLMNKLARQVLGTNNIDLCSNLYHVSTVAGLDEALGLHSQTHSLDDVASHARSILVIGSNTTEEHPVFGAKIRQAVLRRAVKLVVAHPDFINISEYAALRLIHKFGSDPTLIYGLIHIILEKGWEDRAFLADHTQGFTEFKNFLKGCTAEKTSEITGVPVQVLYKAAEILVTNRPTAIVWGSDLTKSDQGKASILALANLQLVLGDLWKQGGGLVPLRPQNNSQGACDMGGIPDLLPGYQPVEDLSVRQKFEAAWGASLPFEDGLSAPDMLSAAERGDLKAIYILGEDLVASSPGSLKVRKGLQSCEYVILQAMLELETAAYADVLLPGTSFAEKTGTVTNTERQVQMVRQAINPVGESKPDWMIFQEIANRIKMREAERPGRYSGWDYHDVSEIMAEIAALTPLYGGISHARLENQAGLQWPVDAIDHPGTPTLLIEQFKPGKFTY